MKFSRLFLFTFFGVLVLFGAGCIQLKGGKSTDAKLGMWKSVDGGQKFEAASRLPTPRGVGTIASISVRELVRDPSDRFALYLGTDQHGLFYSYDGGDGWMHVREPNLSEGRVRAIAVDPSDKCTIYVTRGQRLYKSEDCSRTFNSEAYVDTRADVVLTDIEIDWYNPKTLYLSTTEGEVIKSSDAGRTWATIYRAKSQINDIHVDAKDSRIILVATARRGIHRSMDAGQSWSIVLEEDTFPKLDDIEKVKGLEQDAKADYTWASSDYGLMVSRDHGATWNAVPLVTPPGSVKITSLAVNPRNGAHIVYAAGGTMYFSTNGGAKWDTEKSPVTGAVSELLIDPVDERTLYLGGLAVEEEASLF